MSKDKFAAVELFLHEYKLAALEAVLSEQGTDVQEYMQERLIDLYAEQVPAKTQQEIRQRIDAEGIRTKSTREAER